MTIEDIRKIAQSNQRFTKELKDTLMKEASQYGIVIPQCKCRNKWNDLVMALYHAKKKELEGNTKEVVKAQDKPISVAYRYKFKAGVRINGKIYNSQSSLSDILLLKKHNYALFSRYFSEVYKSITNEKREQNKATSETDVSVITTLPDPAMQHEELVSQEEVNNTNSEDNVEPIKEEVKDALGNEIE